MEIEIKGNPGHGNTFQEVHIEYVQNYVPNATTVITNNYGEQQRAIPQSSKPLQESEREQRKSEIISYVSRLKPHVSKEWQNRYISLWKDILALPEVESLVYEPGKQQNTTFNRNLVAHIIYIMCSQGVIKERNVTKLTIALEGDSDHSVRGKLGTPYDDSRFNQKIANIITNK